ncbi:MAG: hypothetical protein QOG94_1529 [Solirubrobacteraceae bacterium]|nr:hypothetical protein [Solirubrobacteraceae bacterium]
MRLRRGLGAGVPRARAGQGAAMRLRRGLGAGVRRGSRYLPARALARDVVRRARERVRAPR